MVRKGFTLVEIMVVVMIIGVLLMIAVPQWVKIRQNARIRACADNQRVINDGKHQWLMDKNMSSGTVPTQPDLEPEFVKVWPRCPESGDYTINQADQPCECTVHGSLLPFVP
ncbi:prepilin-type N-terminal cleavage/methylation domain-containing protein [Kamptonema cortianum]|nr:prepilin-type N-terminal cleavage/methylation domain-containing protein [Geitlerinema splendidum]MDK3160455.1 prepilin-type N-terminal cleavage/methylation domain-containing protein [Kamptonema cortianum]